MDRVTMDANLTFEQFCERQWPKMATITVDTDARTIEIADGELYRWVCPPQFAGYRITMRNVKIKGYFRR